MYLRSTYDDLRTQAFYHQTATSSTDIRWLTRCPGAKAAARLGEYVVTWRKLQNLTAQVAERAGISRPTLRKLEHGDPSVGLDVFLMVLRALGQLDRMVESVNPYETDLGRARVDWILPTRVRN